MKEEPPAKRARGGKAADPREVFMHACTVLMPTPQLHSNAEIAITPPTITDLYYSLRFPLVCASLMRTFAPHTALRRVAVGLSPPRHQEPRERISATFYDQSVSLQRSSIAPHCAGRSA